MTKIVISGHEFLFLEQPIKAIINLFGVSHYLVRLVSKRMEVFKTQNLNFYNIPVLYEQLCLWLPIPFSLKFICAYHLTFLEQINSYQTYRHLFNLPVRGQRTWGGGRTAKNSQSQVRDYKLKKMKQFFKTSDLMFAAEVVNLLWKQQWPHEWLISRKYQETLPWYVQRKKKWLALDLMASRRIESFFKHPYRFKKKKHHRKKKKINKHIITTGFNFGFSRFLGKNLGML